MKKIYLFVLIMLVPVLVLADAAGPSIIGFDAVVTNKNGAKSTSSDEVIPYNTKIHVFDENGDNKYSVCLMNGENCCEIDGKDIMVLKEEIYPKDLEKNSKLVKENVKAIISNKNGAKVRKGPSEIYEVTKTIPYHSIVDSKYYTAGEGEHGNSYVSWIYLDTNEFQGWIDNDDFSKIIYDEVMLFKDIDLYDDSGNVIKRLNKGQLVSGYTYNKLFYYNNEVLNIKEDFYTSIGSKSEKGYAIVIKSANLISNDGKAITGIPSKTKVKILYGYDIFEGDEDYSVYKYTDPICVKEKECYYYVEYNGQKGFINSQDVVSLMANSKDEIKKFSKEENLYDASVDLEVDDEKKSFIDYIKEFKINTIPANTLVDCYTTKEIYRNYNDAGESIKLSLVNYKGTFGWIIFEYNNEKEIKPIESPIPSNSPKPNQETSFINKDKDNKINSTIIYCIVAGVVVMLSALATIIIINKKKKNRKSEEKRGGVKQEDKTSKVAQEDKKEVSLEEPILKKKDNKNKGV